MKNTLSTLLIPLLTPVLVHGANNYVPLSKGLPEMSGGGFTGGLFTFLNYIFSISIGVAAILAVIMITIGGFKYMTGNSIPGLSGAKDQIQNAIVGLLIVLTSILILGFINPEIVTLRLFQ